MSEPITSPVKTVPTPAQVSNIITRIVNFCEEEATFRPSTDTIVRMVYALDGGTYMHFVVPRLSDARYPLAISIDPGAFPSQLVCVWGHTSGPEEEKRDGALTDKLRAAIARGA